MLHQFWMDITAAAIAVKITANSPKIMIAITALPVEQGNMSAIGLKVEDRRIEDA